MHKKEKIAIAILAAALVLVIGLIIITGNKSADESADAAQTAQTIQPEETADIQTQQETDAAAQTAQSEGNGDGAQTAPDEEAQGTVYEGAIAGLTEEEIAALALAEENVHAGEEAADTEEPNTGSVD